MKYRLSPREIPRAQAYPYTPPLVTIQVQYIQKYTKQNIKEKKINKEKVYFFKSSFLSFLCIVPPPVHPSVEAAPGQPPLESGQHHPGGAPRPLHHTRLLHHRHTSSLVLLVTSSSLLSCLFHINYPPPSVRIPPSTQEPRRAVGQHLRRPPHHPHLPPHPPGDGGMVKW